MSPVPSLPNDEFEALFPKFQPSQVTITLNGGNQHQQRVDVPKGDPRDPMTEDEIAEKFTALGKAVVGEDRCKQLRALIMAIDGEENLDKLFALMMA